MEDWRRRLITKAEDWRLRLIRVAVEDVINVGTVEIPVTLPLTVLCGPNGVGKSTLIKALFATSQTGEIDGKAEPLLRQGKSLITGTFADSDFEIERALAAEGVGTEVFAASYIETSKEPKSYQTHFRTFESVDEIVNGLAKVQLTDRELEELGFLLGKDYRSIDVYAYGEDENWPFFEVSRGDDRYDTRTMGAGELACFHLWWRLKFADRNSLLLIEEPETYVSPYAQRAFAAVLMRFLCRSKCAAIVVSHSASFIQAVPLQSVVFVTKLGQNMEVVPRPPVEFLKKIGMSLVIDTICCVEDNRGYDFLRAILYEFAYDLMQTTSIYVCGSESEVAKSVTGATSLPDCPRLFAVFDGDMRDKLPKELDGYCALLPGSGPPEKVFRVFVTENMAELSASVGQDVRPILDSLEGANHHDWFTKLAENLNLAIPALFNVIFAIWVKIEENAEACRVLVGIIFPSPPEPADEESEEGAQGASAAPIETPAIPVGEIGVAGFEDSGAARGGTEPSDTN